MCIIVVKKKGIDMPSKNTLETCFRKNPDGAGLMYVQNEQVIIDKGYMDFKSFYKRIQKLEKRLGNLKDRAIVMHFRIGTQGANDKQTCHPFPISNKVSDLKSTYFKTNVGMVHNGIMYNYAYDKSLSDTQLFIKDFVSIIKHLKQDFYKDNYVMKLFESQIDNSKLCFLDNKENIYYLGYKVEDNGIYYSNDTYKSYTYKTPKYAIGWETDYYYNYTSLSINKSYKVKDFVNDVKEFAILDVGDTYYCKEYVEQVAKNETIVVDKKYNVYQIIDTDVSLIGTNATIYDSSWNLKLMNFKGGEI